MNKDATKLRRKFLLDPSLVLYLPFDKLDGAKIRSRDGYGHLCTLTAAPWTSEGRIFDAADNGGVIADHPSLNPLAAITIIAIVKGTAWTRVDNYIMAKEAVGQGYEMEVLQNGKAQVLLSCTTGNVLWTSATVLTVGRWYWMGFTWAKPNPRGYINGQSDGNASPDVNDFNISPTTNALNIGFSAVFAGRQLAGVVKKVWIYNRGFTPAEMLDHYRVFGRS